MDWVVILMQDKYESDPYLCTIRHFIGMKMLKRVTWWRWDFTHIRWQLKNRKK